MTHGSQEVGLCTLSRLRGIPSSCKAVCGRAKLRRHAGKRAAQGVHLFAASGEHRNRIVAATDFRSGSLKGRYWCGDAAGKIERGKNSQCEDQPAERGGCDPVVENLLIQHRSSEPELHRTDDPIAKPYRCFRLKPPVYFSSTRGESPDRGLGAVAERIVRC